MVKLVKMITVVGARPNFIKIAPIVEQLRRYDDLLPILVYTGQHYDETCPNCFSRNWASANQMSTCR
jgi:UDP-N-acetylglucosamine 2-epimerase (non-hydrolysing)